MTAQRGPRAEAGAGGVGIWGDTSHLPLITTLTDGELESERRRAEDALRFMGNWGAMLALNAIKEEQARRARGGRRTPWRKVPQ